jgi:flavin reductase (DIM6/NTAB) family NADH-FMN oxidoreductase RutF
VQKCNRHEYPKNEPGNHRTKNENPIMLLTTDDILRMEQRYRTTFVNSLSGFHPVVLVGSRSAAGKSHLATFNSLVHIGANPPLFGLISRPDTVKKQTLTNIRETGVYSINFLSTEHIGSIHQTAARFDDAADKFRETGLTECTLPESTLPFVKEASVKIAMRCENIIPIPANGTWLIVGAIEAVEIRSEIIAPDGFVRLHDEKIAACAGLDAYFSTTLLNRFAYPKAGEPAKTIG